MAAAYCVNSPKPDYTRFEASKVKFETKKGPKKENMKKGTSASDPGTARDPSRGQSMHLQLASV